VLYLKLKASDPVHRMFRLAAAVVLAAIGLSAQGAAAKDSGSATGSVLYNYDQLIKTWGLVKDLASMGYNTAHDALPPPAKEQIAQLPKLKEEPMKLYKQHAEVHVNTAHGIATNLYNQALNALVDPVKKVNAIIDTFVEKFERRHPSSKGMIPTDAFDRGLFVVYIYFCLSLLWKVVMIVKGIFCYIFCCGMCSKRGDAKPKQKSAPKAAPAKPKMKK